jgi:hypothetical protein
MTPPSTEQINETLACRAGQVAKFHLDVSNGWKAGIRRGVACNQLRLSTVQLKQFAVSEEVIQSWCECSAEI